MPIPASPFARYRVSQLALSDGDPVDTWADEGSGGNDLAQTGAVRPTFEVGSFNGRDAVLFDGAGDHMQTAVYAAALSQPTSIVIMGEYVTVSVAVVQYVFDAAASSDRQVFLHDGGVTDDPWIMISPSAALTTDTPVGKAGDDLCIVAIYNGNTSELRINNGADVQANNPGANALGSFSLMARFDATSNQANMRIVEVLIYDRALNGTELTDLQDYFQTTYIDAAAISVDINHGVVLGHSVDGSSTVDVDVSHGVVLGHSVIIEQSADVAIAHGLLLGHAVQVSQTANVAVAHGLLLGHTVAVDQTTDVAVAHGIVLGHQVAITQDVSTVQVTHGLTLGHVVAMDQTIDAQVAHGLLFGHQVDIGVAIANEVQISHGLVLGHAVQVEVEIQTGPSRPIQPFIPARPEQPDTTARPIQPLTGVP